ncbi:ABC transporter ATP-binding protein [Streptomyces sp. NPDC050560]|uniref:ABC transporter ATP-binding protein n=1 Tax=Streptomyces sp. NPDC050560 TaxID=3365630 RepID=UPI0037A6D52D
MSAPAHLVEEPRPDSPAAGAAPGPPGAAEGRLPVATGARARAAALGLLRPDRRRAALAGLLLIAATGVGLLTQPLLGRVVDLVADGRPAGALTLPAVLLAAVALAQGVATALGRGAVARVGEALLARLRERFVDRALALPADRLERAGAGDLTSRVTDDVARVSEAVRSALPELVSSALTIALTFVALAVLDWRFLLAALLAAPVQILTARWYVRRAVPLYARQRVVSGARQQQLLETVGGADTVRAHLLEDDHTVRVARRSLAAVGVSLRGVRLVLGFYGRLHVAEYIGLVAVLGAGFWLVRGHDVSLGTATAAALYFHSLFGPVNAALVLLDDAQTATAGLARLVGVTDLADTAPRPGAAAAPARTAESPEAVRARSIRHAYGTGEPVLHGVDLVLREGEQVALVGASGAGKSTLARIVAGVQPPTSGEVTLPEPRRPGAPAAVLVSQEPHVFAGTLADDLRLAAPGADDARLRAALDEVEALEWALGLPEGLDTVVGDGGHQLDAARAQQLALARLVLADPAVAVLDEATAEAGSAGARVLERCAGRALRGRTALVVAHRLTQSFAADRVVVLDAGRVVQEGPHRELARADGPYARLWAAWSGDRARPLPDPHGHP